MEVIKSLGQLIKSSYTKDDTLEKYQLRTFTIDLNLKNIVITWIGFHVPNWISMLLDMIN